MRSIFFAAAIWMTACGGMCHAEINKIAVPQEGGVRFVWWPKAAAPSGWYQDKRSSLRYGINAMAPIGSDFANAPSVLYTRAVYKPRRPELTSIDDLIGSDRLDFLSRDPKMQITQAEDIETSDGQALISFIFTPGSEGSHEVVAYGEEGDFFLLFVLSSRSQHGLKAALPSFRALIEGYAE